VVLETKLGKELSQGEKVARHDEENIGAVGCVMWVELM
jgi:hypothetical protein